MGCELHLRISLLGEDAGGSCGFGTETKVVWAVVVGRLIYVGTGIME